MALTDSSIRNLKPKDRPYKVSDYDGLHILVNPGGSKLWRFKYRIQRKEKLLSIGSYPAISLAQARQARDAARSQVAVGEDPSAKKREQAENESDQSFQFVAKQYLDKISKEGRAPVTLAKTEWLMAMANADFGKIRISEITAPMVLRCLRKVEAKGHYETARRLRSRIGAVFRYAVATGIADMDPTFALRDALVKPTVTSRPAITDQTQLGNLMRTIDGYTGQITTRIALQLLAILVQRPGELRYAKWDQFDLEAGIWSIPAEVMKMRRPHRVPLPAQALALLEDLRRITGNGVLLFPSLRSVQRPMSENTLNSALRRMGFSGDEMTAHGFRATFSTIANESSLWNPDAIERALAHVEANEVRRAYARGEHWDERIKLADWWAGQLDELKAR